MWIQEAQKMANKEAEQIKSLNQTVHSKDKQERDQAYNDYVKQVTPTHNLIFNMVKAFFTGGIICCIGQFILNTCENYGLDKDTSGGWCSMLLILLSVILTGFNIYPSIANWGGAGALVPITGFANGVAAPAIEFQKEGQVFGIGCKIFTIAGPVILYGIFQAGYWGLSTGCSGKLCLLAFLWAKNYNEDIFLTDSLPDEII